MADTTLLKSERTFHTIIFWFLLLCSITQPKIFASPVNNPDITGKINHNIGVPEIKNKQIQKQSSQELPLNSLSAYAASYESSANTNAQNSFKPSYKLPNTETNFSPMQNIPSTAVLLQYFPQTMNDEGVQYLQLIPTRPIIVPISSLEPLTKQLSSSSMRPLHTDTNIGDYGIRSAALISAINPNEVVYPPPSLVNIPTNLGLPALKHSTSLQPYHNNNRINREVKNRSYPYSINLNINEYIPRTYDEHRPTFVTARP